MVCRELHIEAPEPDLTDWTAMVERIHNRSEEVHIGLVGKYVKLHDAYLSVAEAMNHAGYEENAFVKIHWIDSEGITRETVMMFCMDWMELSFPAVLEAGELKA